MTPGTRQGRLWVRTTTSVKMSGACTREDDLDRTRPSPGSAAIGFRGGVWAGQGAVTSPGEGPLVATRTRAPRCQPSTGPFRRPCLTATATATTNGKHQRPTTARDARTSCDDLDYVRPEKRKVGARPGP